MAQKDFLDRVQVIFTVLTPLLLGVGGFFISSSQSKISESLDRLEKTISSVEAMKPYFDMLAGEDPAKAKMAGYALYMLNREEPDMAVRFIMAANHREVPYEILAELGKKDRRILDIVGNMVLSKEGETEGVQNPIEASAKSIIQDIATESVGWSFMGTFDGEEWSKPTIRIGNELPTTGKSYEIVDDVYLRESKPELPSYKLGKILSVLKVGDKIRVEELTSTAGGGRVWAKVSIVPSQVSSR